MSEKKLDTFHFYKQSETSFRIVHKSGLVEILQAYSSGTRRVAWPVQIFAPSGHSIKLKHTPFNSSRFMLESISDDEGQTLLSIERSTTSVEVALLPMTESSLSAKFILSLTSSDKRVSRITLPTENNASWQFDYGFENADYLCIKRVRTPTGAIEDIYYDDSGHEFPASARRTAIPRVTRHMTTPGFSQPTIDVRYTYKDRQQRSRNFLGAGLNINWEDNGLDNLFKHLDDYDYVCTESLWVAQTAVRSIERTFNRFHLQTLEVTTQNNNSKTVETTYYIEPRVPYDRQVNYCLLPKDVTTTWTDLNSSRSRSETSSKTYDIHGNLLVHIRADGIRETSTWYPAEGDDGCPASPEGFVDKLKDKTTTPAVSQQDTAQTVCARYRYTALPALTKQSGDDLQMPDWIVPESETLVQMAADGVDSEQVLQQIQFKYFNQPSDRVQHGQIQSRTQTLGGQSIVTAYTYRKLISPELNVPVQEVIEHVSSGFDDVSKTVLRQLSTLTSHELLLREEGVETRRFYDTLNRLTLEIAAPGTPFEARRQYQYLLCANEGEQAEQEMTNARGVLTRTRLDGLGRAIYEEQSHLKSSDLFAMQQIFAATYSTWNNLEQETTYDWMGDDLPPLALKRNFAYDDWNQRCCITDAQGVQSYLIVDPIGNVEHNNPVQRSWIESGETTPVVSGRSETWLNVFNKPDRIISLDAADKTLGTRSFLYDGLGRCTQQTDELQQITQFSYDAWSRMITTTLPDLSVVRRDYALHSNAELPVSLEVAHPDGTTKTVAGTQAFDGLERMTETRVGPRAEQYTYDGGKKQPSTLTMANGETITYSYNLALTDQIVASVSTAADENTEFDYDVVSARMTRAQNAQGTRVYDYDVLNRLREETWTDHQGKTWKTSHQISLQSRQLKRTEHPQNNQPTLETVFEYDAKGRVERIQQGNLQASFEYNGLSQIHRVIAQDRAANTALTTSLEYDSQGREVLRTQSMNQQPQRTVEQVWQADGLLESRHSKQADTSLLLEQFTYDTRGRLTQHTCSGSTLPRDALGRQIVSQLFTFDALDNITLASTSFPDDSSERAIFRYASDNPCQLSGIVYRPSRATPDPTFTYDANGNMLIDERGQQLDYDSQNRLLSVTPTAGQPLSAYRYDSHDNLVASRYGDDETLRFYEGNQLSSSVKNGAYTRYLYVGEEPLGQQTEGNDDECVLLLTDASRSVAGEFQRDKLRTAVYNAYGEQHADEPLLCTLGFNGEARESDSGWYLLGRGYRAYNPCLMRFHSPDFLSPFGSGGVNPYAYCLGNPIALRDPTGHDASSQSGRLRRPDEDQFPAESGGSGWEAWLMLGVSVVITAASVYFTATTYGLATPITGPVTVAGITMSASAATTLATVASTAMVVGTGIGVVSTGVQAYGVIANDPTAEQVAFITGFVAVPLDFGSGALLASIKSAAKAAASASARASVASVTSGLSNVGDDSIIGANRTLAASTTPRSSLTPSSISASGSAPLNPASLAARRASAGAGASGVPHTPTLQSAPNASAPVTQSASGPSGFNSTKSELVGYLARPTSMKNVYKATFEVRA
ncbi:sugar-binding protein [Pseudomonas asturiensis]|uniref:Sugar-binding protein n=2 Tax=Pseudomonas asturiensis TaxID=1190415 RepID=A0ABX6HKN8_9PSED|nr:sugar-binding protein [Pseudomonas asturiensis]